MKKERRHHTAEEKVAILRRHLLDKVPVSDLCEELSLKPTVFYRWPISDNGPQFIARDFREFIRISGMTHVRASPYYPQSNGKLERWHKSLKRECIRERTPLSLEDAKRLIQDYVDRYNHVRLHSAIGYVTPNDMLMGRQAAIHAERDRKLEQARKQRHCDGAKRMVQAGIRMAEAPSNKAFRVRSQRSNFSEFQQSCLTALIVQEDNAAPL
jgi:Integrase core domain/Transposase